MFKKSLLALALTGVALSGVANAATIAVTAGNVPVALEGNQTTAIGNNVLVAADAGDVITTAGTSYIINDVLTFTVSGAAFDATVTPTAVNNDTGASLLTFVDYVGTTTARFRVSGVNSATSDTITFAGWSLKTSAAVDKSTIKFTSSALSSNSSIGSYDTTAVAATAFTFGNQLTTVTTKFNGIVSTGAGRAEFTAAGTGANKDVLTIANTDNAGVDALTIAKSVHVITGNFNYVLDYDLVANGGDADGVMDVAEIAAAVTDVGCTSAVATFNTGLTTLTVTDTGALAASCAIELNNVGNTAGGSVIASPQSFTVTSTYTDAGSNAIVAASSSAGSFTLDGSGADIAFLPFGSDYAQSITVTNAGTVEGAITVDLTAGGTTYTSTIDAIAAAKSVTDISTEVAAFAAASGIIGNARVNVTVNAPGIIVKGLYYHKPTQDRVLTQ
jgi:hypothetical protein